MNTTPTTEIASEAAFLVGLDLHVQKLANDAAEMWRTGQISKDAFHKLITDYTHLRAEIRFRGRDIAKQERDERKAEVDAAFETHKRVGDAWQQGYEDAVADASRSKKTNNPYRLEPVNHNTNRFMVSDWGAGT